MIVTINGRYLSQRITGVQRHARELVQALDAALGSENATGTVQVQLLAPRDAEAPNPELRHIEFRRVGSQRGQLWEQLDLPRYRSGTLLNLCNTYPLLAQRQVTVIHDASVYAFPEGYTPVFVAWYKLLFRIAALRRDIQLVTDSEFSAGELSRYAGFDRKAIRVVYCGADHWGSVIPDATVLDRLELRDARYVMAVASGNRNKNIARLIAAFESLRLPDLRLVLSGGNNSSVFAPSDAATAANIVRTGYVSDSELAALYGNALCFVFPSLYEGFGLPPLEAMSFGCPVICSQAASLPEVGGNAVLYCSPNDTQSIAECIRTIIDDTVLQDSLRTRGKTQVEKFRWSRAAREMLALLRVMP